MTEAAARIIELTWKSWEQEMNVRLMSPQDLFDITGKKKPSAQARVLNALFGFEPVRRPSDGAIVLTWDAYHALQRKRCGVASEERQEVPELCL